MDRPPPPPERADVYAAHYTALAAANGAPAWVQARRQAGLARFQALGYPTTDDEDWRFTDLTALKRTAFAPAPAEALPGDAGRAAVAAARLPGDGTHLLVLVDGRYRADLSAVGALPPGVVVGGLAAALAAGDPRVRQLDVAVDRAGAFAALNTAFLRDGACVLVPDGAALDRPVEVLHLASGAAPNTVAHPRVLVHAGRGAALAVIETYAAAADAVPYFTNAVTDLTVGADAQVEHCRHQREGATAFHVGTVHATLGAGANFSQYAVSTGAQLGRGDVTVAFAGEHAECRLNGLYLGAARQLLDTHSTLDHQVAHGTSRQVYKGVLADHARGVFSGRIVVRPGAQQTDAKQSNRALLLSDDARVNSKPQLEIYADDVKCTHGATVGQLDAAALFFLRARGLAAAQARGLLTYAFAAEALEGLRTTAFRDAMDQLLLVHFGIADV